MGNFSALRTPLDGEHFDVVVIGGGINGVAIARECARAGCRTLVVEQHDFGSGTTSRSTRIIHGGLRYLEHGEIALVRESLRERERLLRQYPHLVQPIKFLLALNNGGGRSALQVRFALWLYRRFAGGNVRRAGSELVRLERLLDSGRCWTLFDYDDAQCEFPERLVAEWLTDAVAFGAVARNYVEALEVRKSCGRVVGIIVRDLISGLEEQIDARRVINATGPWGDQLCRQSGLGTDRMIGGVRGSHVVLPRFPGAPDTAVYAEAVDGRPIFIVPWNGQLLLGTTEVPDDRDPGAAQASEGEIEYLFDSFCALFPRVRVGWHDIRHSFAGVRPLPFAPGKAPSSTTRRHILRDHAADGAAGLISVIGGKLTTAASLARACARKIGLAAPEPHAAPAIPELCDAFEPWATQVSAATGLSCQSVLAIAEWHGPRADAIARSATKHQVLCRPICPHTKHIVAEAVHAVEHECAATLADILLRRVPVSLGPCWSPECARIAASAIGAALEWAPAQMAAQLEAFELERAEFLRSPQRASAGWPQSERGERAA